MLIDSLCPPAVLYLGFSIIQIIIDLFRGQQNSAFLKVIVMIIFTILLNQLCIGGLTVLSWFIVFIPFIMMTYVTTILLYVFGLNPSKGKHPQPDPRRRHRRSPYPYNPQDAGGCAGTEFGCCPDGLMVSDEYGSNCYGDGPHPYYRGSGRQQYSPAPTTATTASCATVAPSATAAPSVAPSVPSATASATAVPSATASATVAPTATASATAAPSGPTAALTQTLNSDFQSMYSGMQQYM